MYLLTIEKIENILNKAHNILSQIYPQYVPPIFTDIKILIINTPCKSAKSPKTPKLI